MSAPPTPPFGPGRARPWWRPPAGFNELMMIGAGQTPVPGYLEAVADLGLRERRAAVRSARRGELPTELRAGRFVEANGRYVERALRGSEPKQGRRSVLPLLVLGVLFTLQGIADGNVALGVLAGTFSAIVLWLAISTPKWQANTIAVGAAAAQRFGIERPTADVVDVSPEVQHWAIGLTTAFAVSFAGGVAAVLALLLGLTPWLGLFGMLLGLLVGLSLRKQGELLITAAAARRDGGGPTPPITPSYVRSAAVSARRERFARKPPRA